jgi:hypothetical protein
LFWALGIRIVRYADDFVLMGRTLPTQAIEKLKELSERMGLRINEEKTRQIDARKESFNFLGFTIRYDRDAFGRNRRYWNIIPSKKSEKKIREKVKEYLKTHGHCRAETVANELNTILRGWLNYFDIQGISYPAMSRRDLRYYLHQVIYRYYYRKSQRKCKLYGQNAFEELVNKYNLIDPTKFAINRVTVKTFDERYRKAVCGKPHVRFDEGAGAAITPLPLYSTEIKIITRKSRNKTQKTRNTQSQKK